MNVNTDILNNDEYPRYWVLQTRFRGIPAVNQLHHYNAQCIIGVGLVPKQVVTSPVQSVTIEGPENPETLKRRIFYNLFFFMTGASLIRETN